MARRSKIAAADRNVESDEPGPGGNYSAPHAINSAAAFKRPVARTKMKADPLLAALIARLPSPGSEWSTEAQVQWLRMLAMAFGTVYGGDAVNALSGPIRAVPTVKTPTPALVPEHPPFFVDENGIARRRGGKRVMPKEVSGEIVDLRGEDGDMRTITWADDSQGIAAFNGIIRAA